MVLGAILGMLLSAGLLTTPHAPVAAPRLTLQPATAIAGASVRAVGRGFDCGVIEGSGGAVELRWENTTTLALLTTDGKGGFDEPFNVPVDVHPGTYTVAARCALAPGHLARNVLTVVPTNGGPPRIMLDPATGSTGDAAEVAGQAFTCDPKRAVRSGTVSLDWDGTPLGVSAKVSEQGAFTAGFVVPEGAAGAHTVTARCDLAGGSTAAASFTVETRTPTPEPSPPTPTPSESIPSPTPQPSSEPTPTSESTTLPTSEPATPRSPRATTPPTSDPMPPPTSATSSPSTSDPPDPPVEIPRPYVAVIPAVAAPATTVNVKGRGYAGICTKFALKLDGKAQPLVTRVAAVAQPAVEAAVSGDFVVPEHLGAGRHRLSLACVSAFPNDSAGTDLTVRRGGQSPGWQRSPLAAALPAPGDLPTDPRRALASILLAGLILLAIGFPAELANKTYEEHEDEILRFLHLRGPDSGGEPSRLPRSVVFLGFGALAAGLMALGGKGGNLDRQTTLSAFGLFVAILVVTAVYSGVGEGYRRRVARTAARLRLLPGGLLIAAVCAAASRLARFQPGYVYGLIVVFTVPRTEHDPGGPRSLSDEERGRAVLYAATATLATSMVAWLAWIPFDAAADRGSHHLPTLIADTCLATVVVMGIESVLFGLIPLRFLDGFVLAEWSRRIWRTMLGLTAVVFAHLLFVAKAEAAVTADLGAALRMLALFAAFGAASVAFWGFFALRARRA